MAARSRNGVGGIDEAARYARQTCTVSSAYRIHPGRPSYMIKDWPSGYALFNHLKGPSDKPRSDFYLYGIFHMIDSCIFTNISHYQDQQGVIVPSWNSYRMPFGSSKTLR